MWTASLIGIQMIDILHGSWFDLQQAFLQGTWVEARHGSPRMSFPLYFIMQTYESQSRQGRSSASHKRNGKEVLAIFNQAQGKQKLCVENIKVNKNQE